MANRPAKAHAVLLMKARTQGTQAFSSRLEFRGLNIELREETITRAGGAARTVALTRACFSAGLKLCFPGLKVRGSWNTKVACTAAPNRSSRHWAGTSTRLIWKFCFAVHAAACKIRTLRKMREECGTRKIKTGRTVILQAELFLSKAVGPLPARLNPCGLQ